MARRRIAEAPMSRLAIWARRSAIFSLLAAVIAIAIVRSGMLEIQPALATFGAALVLAALAILLALGAFVTIWKDGIGGLGRAFFALLIGVLLLAYPSYLGIRGWRLPAINDITTDPTDPPRFDVIARLRPRGTSDYPGAAVAEQQRAAYPDLEPLSIAVTPQAAYDAAISVINKRKWRVVVDRPPQPGRRDGQIEAVARTAIMGFRDDVALRVRSVPDGARIDVRSASRFGRHDLGTNAARIRSLLEEVEEVSAATERRPPRQTPARPAAPAQQQQRR